MRVVQLSDKRGPAPVARTLYEESEESRAKRALEVEKRRRFIEPAALEKLAAGERHRAGYNAAA